MTITSRDMNVLHRTLLRPDRDEHAAFVFAGVSHSAGGSRLLVREVAPIADDEFIPSNRGAYRQITSRAVARAAHHAEDTNTCIIWAHSHPLSGDRVGFSGDDRASMIRAHPTLMELTDDKPVAALVFSERAVAGEIWTPAADPAPLRRLRVLGPSLADWTPAPTDGATFDDRRARQILMFGEAGQDRLRRMTVAVIGVGGGGSVLVQQLVHLGVGTIIVIDHDRVSRSNLSRIVGATASDVGRLKVDVAYGHAKCIDPDVKIVRIAGDITYAADACLIKDADFAFLATDTASARHAYNLICHQYLVPGIQIGAKVTADSEGAVSINVMNRAVMLGEACLHCARCIPAAELHREQQTVDERRAQDYIDHIDIDEPSVITLNTLAAGAAATEFMLVATGLAEEPSGHRAYYPLDHEITRRKVDRRDRCLYCGTANPLASSGRGDLWPLQLTPGHSPTFDVRGAHAPWWHRLTRWFSRASPG